MSRSRGRRRTPSSPSTSRCGGARRRTSSRTSRTARGSPRVERGQGENKDVNAVAETCERLGLTIAQFSAWGFKPGLNDPKNHSQFVEKIDKSCEIAKKWKCSLMCVVGGDDIPGVSQEKMHENIIEGVRKGGPIAEKHAVTLLLGARNIPVD